MTLDQELDLSAGEADANNFSLYFEALEEMEIPTENPTENPTEIQTENENQGEVLSQETAELLSRAFKEIHSEFQRDSF